ncbi:MAG: hypothetical protein IKU43_05780 [Clostridia bacterium]|nr:hypothetical protein [Clostridia bacterium]
MSNKAKIITLSVIFVICIGMIIYAIASGDSSFKDALPKIIIIMIGLVISVIKVFNRSPAKSKLNPEALSEDIATAKAWIEECLVSSGYRADYTLDSLKDIDRFFDEHSGDDGIIAGNKGRILFGIGVYVGETMLALCGGEWVLEDAESEMHIKIKLSDDSVLFPVLRTMARYQYGNSNSIYAYGKKSCKK